MSPHSSIPFAELLQTTPLAFILLNKQGDVYYANPATAALFSRDLSEILEKGIPPLLTPKSRSTFHEGLARCQKDQPVQLTLYSLNPNAEVNARLLFYLLFRLHPFSSKPGKTLG